MSFFAVPYIIKATLNPVTFIQMTKAYWSSLLNHNYLKENTVCVWYDGRMVGDFVCA
jgi:hypothetical protein